MRLTYPVAQEGFKGNVKALTGSYQENFSFLKSEGYEAVELLIEDAKKVDLDSIRKALTESELSIAAIGTTPMQMKRKLFLIHPDEKVRKEARKECSDFLRLCAQLQAPALLGKYRGMVSEMEGCREENLMELLSGICDEAAELGVTVLIEPQNETNINNINTVQDGLDLINQLQKDNLGLLLDVYHMGITEQFIPDSIYAARDYVGFIHLADSERKIPGDGKMPLVDIINAMKRVHISADLSLEIDQLPTAKEAAKLSAMYLRKRL